MQFDIIELITRDHELINDLLVKLGETTPDDTSERKRLWPELFAILRGHTSSEEEVVYRRLRNHRDVRELVAGFFESHHDVAVGLERLQSMNFDDAEWSSCLAELKEKVEHHVSEEEHQLLPQIKKLFSLDMRHEMAVQMRQLEERSLHESANQIPEQPVHKPDKIGENAGARIF